MPRAHSAIASRPGWATSARSAQVVSGADVELSVALLDLTQLEARDVDDERRPRDAELHDRDERLPAGDRLRVGLGEQLERVVEVGRARVPGRRGDHEAVVTARIDSTIPW